MIVVSNATPLIGLSRIGQLSLLQELFGAVWIPQAVYDEVVRDKSGRPGVAEIQQAEWIHVKQVVDRTKVDYLRADLDPGEAEVLVLGEELRANWLLLDETKARLAAELLEMRFIGTVGLLLLAKRKGRVAAVRSLLDQLRTRRFYISDRVYQAVLRQAGE